MYTSNALKKKTSKSTVFVAISFVFNNDGCAVYLCAPLAIMPAFIVPAHLDLCLQAKSRSDVRPRLT